MMLRINLFFVNDVKKSSKTKHAQHSDDDEYMRRYPNMNK